MVVHSALARGLGERPTSTGAFLMGRGTGRRSCVPDTPGLGLPSTDMQAGYVGLICQTGNRVRSVSFILHWLCPSKEGFGPWCWDFLVVPLYTQMCQKVLCKTRHCSDHMMGKPPAPSTAGGPSISCPPWLPWGKGTLWSRLPSD